MDQNFIFGQIAWGEYFAGREWLTERLVSKLSSLKSIILISPRGWGKTSLVYSIGKIISNQHYNYRTCYIDLQNIYSEEAFQKIFVHELSGISTPNFLTENNYKWHMNDILNLPEYIAINDRIKLIVFIGNIDKIANFRNSLQFQKKLKSKWSLQKNCAYCLYGNNQQVTRYLLDTPYKPFRMVGQLFHLPKIHFNELTVFIQKRFQKTGKQISEQVATAITIKANCLPHYVQLLSWHAWIRTESTCTHNIVDQAIEHLMLQFSLHYQTLTDTLTEKQVLYLKALLNHNEKICSRDTLLKYNLGTSANISRLRTSLKNKEIIDTDLEGTFLLDPIYACWLQKYYFRI